MRFNKLQGNNFQSFEEIDLDLSGLTITGIIGQYKGNANKSNGAGKSTILELILWIIFGRGRTALEEDLIRTGADSMRGFLQFELNGREIEIERTKTKSKGALTFSIDGKDLSEGKLETQAKIEKAIGMDFELFTATVFFEQAESDNFTAATAGVRKDYLKNILKLDFYDKCYEEVRAQMAKVEERMNTAKSNYDFVKNELEDMDPEAFKKDLDKSEKEFSEIEKNIEEARKFDRERGELENDEETAKHKVDDIGFKIDELEKEFSDGPQKIKTLKAKIVKLEAPAKVPENDFKKMETEIESLRTEERTCTKDMSAAETKQKNNIRYVEVIEKNCDCPLCRRAMPDKLKGELVATLTAEIEENKQVREKLSKQIAEIQKKILSMTAQVRKGKEEFEAVQRQEARRESDLKNAKKELKDYEERFSGYEEKLSKLKEERDTASKKLSSIKKKLEDMGETEYDSDEMEEDQLELKGKISGLKVKIKNCNEKKKQAAELKSEIDEIADEYNDFNNLKNIFGKSGIVSEIIGNSMDEIEENANRILNDIDDGERRIVFEVTKETKTKGNIKDTLEIWIEDDDGTRRKYESFSGGEKTILNFAIRLSLSELLSKREKVWFGVIFLDEVFAALDQFNRDKMKRVINYLKNIFRQIFCISHTELQDSFPHLIVVQKDKKTKISRILEVA